MRPVRGAVTVMACALLLAAGSCGGGGEDSEKAAVQRVLTDLQAASRAGGGRRICDDLFTPKLAGSVARSAKSGDCPTEVRRNLFSPQTQIKVQGIAVSAPSDATATVT